MEAVHAAEQRRGLAAVGNCWRRPTIRRRRKMCWHVGKQKDSSHRFPNPRPLLAEHGDLNCTNCSDGSSTRRGEERHRAEFPKPAKAWRRRAPIWPPRDLGRKLKCRRCRRTASREQRGRLFSFPSTLLRCVEAPSSFPARLVFLTASTRFSPWSRGRRRFRACGLPPLQRSCHRLYLRRARKRMRAR